MERKAIYAGIASMVGEANMSSQDLVIYLTKLLGRPVALDDWVRLTSGQQARVAGWLTGNAMNIPDLRTRLSMPFQPASLLGGVAVATQPTFSTPRIEVERAPGGLRIGIDIQRIDELLPADALADPKASTELTATFTFRGISYAQSRPHPLETLAGLFAAKEALRKCDPALLALPLPEVEVLPDDSGGPRFAGYTLSISHSGGLAVAVAAALSAQPTSASTAVPGVAARHPTPQDASSIKANRLMKAGAVAVAVLIGLLCLKITGWL
jgi:phosphopantetheinyl transferase (holo-ACP synthase)